MKQILVIRNAQVSDAPILSEFAIMTYTAAFGHSFTAEDLAAHLKAHLMPDHFAQMLSEDRILLAEVENRLVGYAQFGAMKPADEYANAQELRRLYVHPAYQNRGVGGALMEAALRQMNTVEAIYLDVWEDNPGAQRFYKRYGFEVIGRRAFVVESGEITGYDLLMIRRASPAGNKDVG